MTPSAYKFAPISPSDRMRQEFARYSWHDKSRRDDPIYAWFTEGFDTRDLKQTKALPDMLASDDICRCMIRSEFGV